MKLLSTSGVSKLPDDTFLRISAPKMRTYCKVLNTLKIKKPFKMKGLANCVKHLRTRFVFAVKWLPKAGTVRKVEDFLRNLRRAKNC